MGRRTGRRETTIDTSHQRTETVDRLDGARTTGEDTRKTNRPENHTGSGREKRSKGSDEKTQSSKESEKSGFTGRTLYPSLFGTTMINKDG